MLRLIQYSNTAAYFFLCRFHVLSVHGHCVYVNVPGNYVTRLT